MGTKEAEQLPEKVRLYMEKENMARPGSRILAGVSGGADSVCLLAVLPGWYVDAAVAACDRTVRIPMAHGVDSLNVAAAAAVAFWQVWTGGIRN